MFQNAIAPSRDWKWILGLTILIEVTTCIFRFGLGMESTRDTAPLAEFTFGWRIHHGYVGILLIIMAIFWPKGRGRRCWALRIGWSLVASDLIHHFLVLWPIVGEPQFHLHYFKS